MLLVHIITDNLLTFTLTNGLCISQIGKLKGDVETSTHASQKISVGMLTSAILPTNGSIVFGLLLWLKERETQTWCLQFEYFYHNVSHSMV